MATKELQLLSRIIRTGEFMNVLEWGIDASDFLTNEGKALFLHIMGYYSQADTAGSVIGPEFVRHVYPNFQLCDDAAMTTAALCNEVRSTRTQIELKAGLQRAMELAEKSPQNAAALAQQVVTDILNLSSGKTTDVSISAAAEQVVLSYELRKRGVDLSCAKWPWPIMNDKTGGIEKEDYIILYGRPKSMKTWVLAYFVASLFDSGKRVLVYTKEMTWETLYRRIIACLAAIEYEPLRLGTLSLEQEARFYEVKELLSRIGKAGQEQFICLKGNEKVKGTDTVPWLRSKVEKYKPEIVAIDGLYLMSDVNGAKKDNERVRNISRDVRQMVLDTGVPAIATVQANRAAAKNSDANLDEVAFSDSLSQDATQIIRVINEKDAPTLALIIGGAREFDLNGFRIYGQPAVNFGYYGLLTEKEIEKAKEADKSSEGDNAEAHVKGKKKKPVNTEDSAMKSLNSRLNNMGI